MLHNFLLKDSEVSATSYCPPGTADHEDWEGRSVSGSGRGDTDIENATLQALPRTGYNSTRHVPFSSLCCFIRAKVNLGLVYAANVGLETLSTIPTRSTISNN